MDVSKYAALFLAESRENLRVCNQLLLEWEREPSATGQVGGLFRAIHTIKGMGATMGYAGVADLAHRLENLLDALRQRIVAPSPAVFQLLFRSVDALSTSVEGAVTGSEAPADQTLAADLDAAAAGVAPATPAPDPTPMAGNGGPTPEGRRVRPVQVALRRDGRR
jgi:two-component system chemotaxis sensor kinase CheA